MVTAENNNKFYSMKQINENEFKAEWGRVGVTSTTKIYPMSKWDSTYKEKVKKGYKDQTELFVSGSKTIEFDTITNDEVSYIVSSLQRYAKTSTAAYYNVTAEQVTQKQVDTAQEILNRIATSGKIVRVNDMLLELYSVIPRKMNRVQDHLLSSKLPIDKWNTFISKQQDILDSMSSQVSVITQTKDESNKNKTILEALGLELYTVTKDEERKIKGLMGSNSNKFSKAYSVIHKKTVDKFNKYTSTKDNTESELLWHGSRNENWWSILQTGLILRPTNAIITGKMFGYGIYFANKAEKSIGYTSSVNSYWAKGNSEKAYLSLFKVHTGNRFIVDMWGGRYGSFTEDTLKQEGNYDSLHAIAGSSLRNDEIIIYNENQCTINYLIEIK